MNNNDMTNGSNHPLYHAQNLLGNKQSKKVTHNTRLEREPKNERITLTLHGHTIMEIGEGNRFGLLRLWSCGYHTVTTKDRMNRMLPYGARVFQKNHEWFLTDKTGTRPFYEGIGVHL